VAVVAAALGVAVIGPAAADEVPGPGEESGIFAEGDYRFKQTLKIKLGLCQGAIHSGLRFFRTGDRTFASFRPTAGCRSSAIQFWYLNPDNSLHWSPEGTSTGRDTAVTDLLGRPELMRVVVTVEDSTGKRGRFWANLPGI
jgi:hypothetical protein